MLGRTILGMTIPPLAEATLWLALILAMTAGLVFFARKLSGRKGDGSLTANELLNNFREVHARGGLSDFEYRTIKTKLAPELQSAERAEAAAADGDGAY